MKRMLFIIILFILLVVGLFFVIKKNKNMNLIILNNNIEEIKNIFQYGEKVQYEKGTVIQFPDFRLVYIGDKWLSGKNGATWSMVFNLFEISDGKISKEISWSSGTGNIGPNPFEFKGKKYNIEKTISDNFGQLKLNELIINVEK